jgi:hypothetical protein
VERAPLVSVGGVEIEGDVVDGPAPTSGAFAPNAQFPSTVAVKVTITGDAGPEMVT